MRALSTDFARYGIEQRHDPLGAWANVKWGALLIVGTFFVVAAGASVYLPARWLAKHKLRSAPADSAARRDVTSAGLAHAV